MTAPAPPVEPCCRCGAPAELPVVGSGHVTGQDAERVPVGGACLEADSFLKIVRYEA